MVHKDKAGFQAGKDKVFGVFMKLNIFIWDLLIVKKAN
jgi:hypothetical protein